MLINNTFSHLRPGIRPTFQAAVSSIHTTSTLNTDSIKARTINDHQPLADAMRKLAYTGNPFETKITRKREVKDLSMPNFEKTECLKWTKWNMLLDVKRRHRMAEYWQYRTNLHSIAKTLSLPALVRELAIEDRNDVPKESYSVRIRNRCAITSRSRGKYREWRLSRILWREQADSGRISGFKRSQWS